MKKYENATGFINLESLTEESNEMMEGNGGATPTIVISIVTGTITSVVTGFTAPTGACTSSCK